MSAPPRAAAARAKTAGGAELFSSVPRRHLWSTTVEQIRELITSGRLVVGAQLPGERELCQQLAISRVSLREAIRVLESMGYVDVRPGRGTFVRSVAPGAEASMVGWLRDHTDRVEQLFEVRELVEPGIAAIVARRRDPEVLAALDEAVAALLAASEAGELRTAIDADAAFHAILAGATGNTIIDGLMRQVIQVIGEERLASLSVPGQVARAARDHRRIRDAITDGDPDAAAAAMHHHLSEARRHIREWVAAAAVDDFSI